MNKDLEHYKNPGGWVEFWIGLVVLLAATGIFGRIAYQENKVRKMDIELKEKLNEKNKTNQD